MEVSHLAELDTHAVIGGGQAQAFFISDSPEFFSILSDNIYRDKKLAVVREVICNADDAHKMGAGCTLPVKITLTDTELSIQDFGPGIHADEMHPTYCGYGVSGKRKDLLATGGFGIGCKAPFSYSDHFTVVSCHAGMRTIYAISRGGVDSQGKPGLIPMVTVPTTETGITVTVPLKEPKDRHDFDRLIRKVVRQGGINAELNGIKLPFFDMTGIEKTGYALASSGELDEGSIYVRYGAVMYPLTTENPEISKLAHVFRNHYDLKLVLAALPGSIGVTPSREALSYSDQTIEVLTNLLVHATKDIKERVRPITKLICKEHIDKIKDPVIPLSIKTAVQAVPFTTDRDQIAKTLIGRAIVSDGGTFQQFSPGARYVTKQLMLAAAAKYRDHRSFFRRLSSNKVRAKNVSSYLNEVAPENRKIILRMASQLGILKDLLRYGKQPAIRTKKGLSRYRDDAPVAFSLVQGPIKGTPILVLCRGKVQAGAYCEGAWAEKHRFVFVNVLRMEPHQISAIKAAAAKFKIELRVLDIEKPAPQPRKPKAVKAEAPKMLFHSFASIHGTRLYSTGGASLETAPVFINMHSTMEDRDDYGQDVNKILGKKRFLLQLYPVVALAFGVSQKKALLDLGAREIQDVFAEDVLKIQDTKENRFIINAARSALTRYDPNKNMVNWLSSRDLRWAKLLTGEKKLTVTPAEQRIFTIFRIWLNFLGSETTDRSKAYGHMYDLELAARKDQLKKENFAYLDHLIQFWGMQMDNHDIPLTNELIDLIRYTQKRAVKADVAPTTNPPVQLLKEAA